MDESHADHLLSDLLERGLVPADRVAEVERLRDSGEVWSALEYAMNGESGDEWTGTAAGVA